METRRRRVGGIGALLLAVLFITVGGYYLLRNTIGFNLPDLNGDAIWPILVIVIGIGFLTRLGETRPAE